MFNLYLVTCFSCDNMTYRLGDVILSCINDMHVQINFFFGPDLDGYYSFYDQVLVCCKCLAHREHLLWKLNYCLQ